MDNILEFLGELNINDRMLLEYPYIYFDGVSYKGLDSLPNEAKTMLRDNFGLIMDSVATKIEKLLTIGLSITEDRDIDKTIKTLSKLRVEIVNLEVKAQKQKRRGGCNSC